MADQGDDRGQPREERFAGDEAEGSNRNRLIVAYAIGSTVVLAIAVLVFVLASGGEETSEAAEGDAHINLNAEIGSTNGIEPDNRAGTPPAAAQVTNLAAAANQAACDLRLKLKDEGHDHIPPGSPQKYGTNPPTSGDHVVPPYQQADGAYAEMPAEIDIVHTLEHGRLEIMYSPQLPEADQLELKGLYDTMYGATLLFPNNRMPYAVAATTWTNLLGCPTYEGAATLDAIRAFGKATWNRYGGEPAEYFPFAGPTPAEPAE
jgi:uncharacterized protein DUF3105